MGYVRERGLGVRGLFVPVDPRLMSDLYNTAVYGETLDKLLFDLETLPSLDDGLAKEACRQTTRPFQCT